MKLEHALALLNRYYDTRLDHEALGESFLPARQVAEVACLDAMGVIEQPAEPKAPTLDESEGPRDFRTVPARPCGCPDDGDGHYDTCLLSREGP